MLLPEQLSPEQMLCHRPRYHQKIATIAPKPCKSCHGSLDKTRLLSTKRSAVQIRLARQLCPWAGPYILTALSLREDLSCQSSSCLYCFNAHKPLAKSKSLGNRDVRVQILIWFQTFLLFTKPHFQTFNAVWMHWKAHLYRYFRLFQTFFSQMLSHPCGKINSSINVFSQMLSHPCGKINSSINKKYLKFLDLVSHLRWKLLQKCVTMASWYFLPFSNWFCIYYHYVIQVIWVIIFVA